MGLQQRPISEKGTAIAKQSDELKKFLLWYNLFLLPIRQLKGEQDSVTKVAFRNNCKSDKYILNEESETNGISKQVPMLLFSDILSTYLKTYVLESSLIKNTVYTTQYILVYMQA